VVSRNSANGANNLSLDDQFFKLCKKPGLAVCEAYPDWRLHSLKNCYTIKQNLYFCKNLNHEKAIIITHRSDYDI